MSRQLIGRPRRAFFTLALVSGFGLAACGGDDSSTDTPDSGGGDAKQQDARTDVAPRDGASEANAPDSKADSPSESAAPDAPIDTGVAIDTGVDTGTPKPDAAEAGPTEAGPTEAGPTEAGPTEAGPTEAGIDGGADASDGRADSSVSDATVAVDGGPDSSVTGDGAVIVTAPVAQFAVTPIAFGLADCGGAAVTRQLAIQNTGTAPLIVNSSISGAAFSVSPTTALILAPGQSGSLTLSATVPATAAAAATLSASLTVTTNDPTHASTAIALSATAHGGTIAWAAGSPTAANFGIAKVNQADSPIALSLTNTGNAPLGITAGAPSGSQFTVTPSAAQSLAAGANLALTAGFTPTELSPSTATSQFAVTGAICGTSVNSLSFSGQGGQGDVTGWPSAALDFGLNPCGGAAPAGQSFTLHNAGAVVAHLSTVAFSGTVGYTTDAAAGASIPANGDLTIHVSAPAIPGTSAVPGTYGDTLTITTDVAGDTSHQVLVTEGARGAVLSWDTAATANFGAFGQVPVGTTANQGFNVVNAGNAAADVTIATQGPFSATPVSFNVAADSLQTGSASFTPTTYGGASNPLSLATTSVICQPLPAALSLAGTGQQGGISLSTQSMSFTTACGATGTPATFTVTNSGNLPMTWTAALLQGAGSAFTFAPATETVAPARNRSSR